MGLMNFNHLINSYLSYFIVISNTLIYKFYIIKFVLFITQPDHTTAQAKMDSTTTEQIQDKL